MISHCEELYNDDEANSFYEEIATLTWSRYAALQLLDQRLLAMT